MAANSRTEATGARRPLAKDGKGNSPFRVTVHCSVHSLLTTWLLLSAHRLQRMNLLIPLSEYWSISCVCLRSTDL